jgi:DNA-binding NtrC family response regulator
MVIFVVDDERVIADTLCAILRLSGYDARAFYDAESALRGCGDQQPDFVISDVSMPGMNGVEMAVQIREQIPGCRVLLFSGNAGTSEVLDAAHQRGYDFELLAKPVHPKDLLARLEGPIQQPSPFTTPSTLNSARSRPEYQQVSRIL